MCGVEGGRSPTETPHITKISLINTMSYGANIGGVGAQRGI